MKCLWRTALLLIGWSLLMAGCGADENSQGIDGLLSSTRALNREFEPHLSPADLTRAAQFVFTGNVVDVSQGRAFYGESDQPPAMVTIQLEVAVTEVIKGSPESLGESVAVEITIGSEDQLSRAVAGGIAAKGARVLLFADDFTHPAWKSIKELGPADDLVLAPWTDGAWLLSEAGKDAALGIYVDGADLGEDWAKLSSTELIASARAGG